MIIKYNNSFAIKTNDDKLLSYIDIAINFSKPFHFKR